MNRTYYFCAAGQLTLALALLSGFIAGEGRITSFLSGFFTGLSLVFNIYFLILYSANKDKFNRKRI